jgi:hypothetical protein
LSEQKANHMPALARTDLEQLLRTRRLDATLTSSRPLADSEQATASSGVQALDARLGGGWPRGQVSEIVGPRASGRTLIAVSSLAAATKRGELAALVDAGDTFDPGTAAHTGVRWSHLLWVRGVPLAHLRVRHQVVERAVDRAIKATGLVLAAGGFGMVVLDLADVPLQALRQVPFTTWLRLQRMLDGRDTVVLVLSGQPLGRGAGGVSLTLATGPEGAGVWGGGSVRSRLFTGLSIRARISRARSWPDDHETLVIAPAPGLKARGSDEADGPGITFSGALALQGRGDHALTAES